MEVYAAMIDRVDQNIGRLTEHLDQLGYGENTLILFVSDNGASAEQVNLETDDDTAPIGSMARWISLRKNWANVSNTPFRYYKNHSYEGGINTPCIAYWPEKIKAGRLTSYPGHVMDFMATFVDIADANYPKNFNGEKIVPLKGKSLVPIFENVKSERKQPLFWEWGDGQAMLWKNYKIVRNNKTADWELYHLKNDPTEIKNLAKEKLNLLTKMERMFQDWKLTYPSNTKEKL